MDAIKARQESEKFLELAKHDELFLAINQINQEIKKGNFEVIFCIFKYESTQDALEKLGYNCKIIKSPIYTDEICKVTW